MFFPWFWHDDLLWIDHQPLTYFVKYEFSWKFSKRRKVCLDRLGLFSYHECLSYFLSDVNAKGDAHGLKNTYKENQIYLLKLLEPEDSWGDTLLSLISDLGGVESLLDNISDLKAKNHFVIVNKPIKDLDYQQSNDISKECIHLLNQLGCNVSFNFF